MDDSRTVKKILMVAAGAAAVVACAKPEAAVAQERIAVQTVEMLLEALGGSLSVTAVNLPFRATTGRGEPSARLAHFPGPLDKGCTIYG